MLGEKTSKSELRARLRDPFLEISLGIRIAVVLGMPAHGRQKPGLAESLGIAGPP